MALLCSTGGSEGLPLREAGPAKAAGQLALPASVLLASGRSGRSRLLRAAGGERVGGAALSSAAVALRAGGLASGVPTADGQVLGPLAGITGGVILAADPACF